MAQDIGQEERQAGPPVTVASSQILQPPPAGGPAADEEDETISFDTELLDEQEEEEVKLEKAEEDEVDEDEEDDEEEDDLESPFALRIGGIKTAIGDIGSDDEVREATLRTANSLAPQGKKSVVELLTTMSTDLGTIAQNSGLDLSPLELQLTNGVEQLTKIAEALGRQENSKSFELASAAMALAVGGQGGYSQQAVGRWFKLASFRTVADVVGLDPDEFVQRMNEVRGKVSGSRLIPHLDDDDLRFMQSVAGQILLELEAGKAGPP